MRRIGGMLGRNPYGPAHEHMLKVIGCLELLGPLVEAACAGDRAAAASAASSISALEQQADDLKKAIRLQFTTSVWAALSRSEVLALLKAQDDVADLCERLAQDLRVRATAFPARLAADAVALSGAVAAAAKLFADIYRDLDASGGRLTPAFVAGVSPSIEKIDAIAASAVPLHDRFLTHLFEMESEVPVLDVVFLMRFAAYVQKIAGKIENVADVLTRLLSEVA